MSDVKLSVPPEFRRGRLRHDERKSVDSGIKLVELISSHTNITDKTLLDFGCGVKLAQALIELGSPQKIYTGVDVYADMIQYMQSALARDSKFHFARVNFQNDMYNKSGEKMAPESLLPIPDETYDIVTMFSVITHMSPKDTETILSILRRYAKDNATLIFSTFLDERQTADFIDEKPDKPLFFARYRRDFLERIIERSGWKIKSLNDGIPLLITRHYVCSPC